MKISKIAKRWPGYRDGGEGSVRHPIDNLDEYKDFDIVRIIDRLEHEHDMCRHFGPDWKEMHRQKCRKQFGYDSLEEYLKARTTILVEDK